MVPLDAHSPLQNRMVVRVEVPNDSRLSKALVTRINAACDTVDDAGSNSILLLSMKSAQAGAGAGDDAPVVDVALVNAWERALRRVERLDATTVSLVEGKCTNLVLAILLATDYRIVSPRVELSLLSTEGDIMPDMSLHRLSNQLGVAGARRLALFGARTDAASAQQLGLIDDVAADVEAAAGIFIDSLLPQRTRDLAIRRRLLLDAPSLSYDEGLGSHLAACDRFLRQRQARTDGASTPSELAP